MVRLDSFRRPLPTVQISLEDHRGRHGIDLLLALVSSRTTRDQRSSRQSRCVNRSSQYSIGSPISSAIESMNSRTSAACGPSRPDIPTGIPTTRRNRAQPQRMIPDFAGRCGAAQHHRHRTGDHPHFVTDRDADPLAANIDPKNPARHGLILPPHWRAWRPVLQGPDPVPAALCPQSKS